MRVTGAYHGALPITEMEIMERNFMERNFIGEIPASLAIGAFHGTSFSPEKRGESVRNDYAQSMQAAYDRLHGHAVKGGTLDMLESEFERYKAGYRARMTAWLHSHARCISSMITGPSNFPVRRAEKRNNIEHRRLTELCEFGESGLMAAIRNLRPDLRPIMSGDANAVERLEEKIVELRARQDRMKAINAAHKAFQKDARSLEDSALSQEDKAMLRKYVPAYSWEPHPFAPYQLSNNNATIRTAEKRLEQLQTAKATPEKTIECKSGLRVEDCPADNRVRLFFPGKPDSTVRDTLKSSGFRWAPSIGAWQAYRNSRAMELAQKFVWDEKRQQVAA